MDQWLEAAAFADGDLVCRLLRKLRQGSHHINQYLLGLIGQKANQGLQDFMLLKPVEDKVKENSFWGNNHLTCKVTLLVQGYVESKMVTFVPDTRPNFHFISHVLSYVMVTQVATKPFFV